MKDKPIFEKCVFGDVNFETLEYDDKYKFVIERVFERGDVQDISNCRRFYGDDKIREVLVDAKWLRLETIYLAAAILDNEILDYRCYNRALLYKRQLSY